MAVQAELIGRLAQLSVIGCAMSVVTIETRNPATVHYALDEVITLHPVLVSRAIGVIKEIRWLAERMRFQLPVIRQLYSHVIANGPIVVLALDWI